jgi:SAM-dependent methyltransferase
MSKGLVGFMAKVLHRNMEKPYRSGKKFDLVLEIGAGGSEHYPFVKHSFDEYWESDLRYEKSTASKFGVNNLTKTKKMFLDAQDLSGLEDNSFNRIIATCVLLHLRDIEGALIQWRRVVSDGGVITIYVPSEPGLLLSVAQYLTTRRKFEKQGVEYHSWQYQEHVSYFPRAKVLINKVFSEDKIVLKKFPVNFFPWHFTLWGVWQITVSKPNK